MYELVDDDEKEAEDIIDSIDFDASDEPTDAVHSANIAASVASIRSNMLDDDDGSEDGDIVDHYPMALQEVELGNSSDVVADTVNQYAAYYEKVLTEGLVEDMPNVAEEDKQDILVAANDMRQEVARQSPDSLEQLQILAIENKWDRQRAGKAYMARKAHELIQGTSIAKTALNMVEFLMPDAPFDAHDFAAKYTDDTTINPFDDVLEINNKFAAMTLEEQMLLWPQLMADMIESYKDFGNVNELKAATAALNFLESENARGGEANLESFFAGMDLFSFGATSMIKLVALGKGFNTIRRLKKAGDSVSAAKVNTAAAADPGVAAAVNQDRTEAVSNMMPFAYERVGDAVSPSSTDGLAAETTKLAEEIERRRNRVQAELDPVLSGKGFIEEDSLTYSDRIAVEARELDKFSEVSDASYEKTGWHLENAEIGNRTPKGFDITYTLEGVADKQTYRYTQDDAGEIASELLDAGAIGSRAFSPSVILEKMMAKAVAEATTANFSREGIVGQLQVAVRAALKGVNKKSRRRVDDILLTGDDAFKGEGTVYTLNELRAGVETAKGRIALTDNEIGSYFAQRDIFDAMHYLKNKEVREQLVFTGHKHVDINLADDVTIGSVGKVYEKGHSALAELKGKGAVIWDAEEGKRLSFDAQDMDDLYKRDYVVVRSRETFTSPDGGKYNVALVPRSAVKDLPERVLNKKVGYVPKIYDKGWYFVKKFGDNVVNGVKQGATNIRGRMLPSGNVTTMRIFDNNTDARAWAKEEELRTGIKHEYLHDREMSVNALNSEHISENGGMYTGSRASHQLKYGLNGDVPVRLSANEAMQRGLRNVANTMPINEWRLGITQKWLNTAKGLIDDPSKGLDAVVTATDGKTKRSLEYVRDWIRDQVHLPTPQEQAWSATVREAAEWMEGRKFLDGMPRHAMMNIAAIDPYAAMRGAAFHTLLGWFNPAQLFVQAQGAAVALSLDPIGFPKRMHELLALRAAYFVRNNPEAIRKTAKAAGIDPDELVEIVREIHKSGLYASAKTTADYTASGRGFGTGGMQAFKNAADKGLLIYTEGERFTRGYSFLTARALWKKANPGKAIDDHAIKEIIDGTTKKMLNLSRANRAHWQKGIWGIPTQFMQVTAKFIESMLPNILPGSNGKFTGWEKMRVMTGQIALYGTAGIPLGGWAVGQIAEMQGKSIDDYTEEEAIAITDGFWGWMGHYITGESFDVGARGGVMSGLEQLLERIMVQDASFPSLAFGAAGALPHRLFQGLGTIAPIIGNVDAIEITPKELTLTAHAFGDVISTYRQAHAALMWYNDDMITDGHGRPLASLASRNAAAIAAAKAAGFSPKLLSDHYSGKQWLRGRKDFDRDTGTAYRKLLGMYLKESPTETDKRNFEVLKKRLFHAAHGGANTPRALAVIESVHKQLMLGETQEDLIQRKVLMSWFDDKSPTQANKQIIMGNQFTEDN